jgi:nucleotide-binding universal stress UspA family protein
MTILCGTDFSALALSAASVAAAFAKSSDQALVLAHVLPFAVTERQERDNRELVEDAERKLEAEAARVRAHCSRVTTQVLFGELAEALIQHAYELKTQLLVVGAHSREASSSWQLGRVTDTLAAKAGVALLVVKGDEPFTAWTRLRKPLRVVIGADDSATTDAAVSFIGTLQALGPCEVSAVHLFWPPVAFERLGLSGLRNFLELDPVVQRTLTEELARRLGGIPVRVEPHLGNVGERLASLAAESGADLVVVGSHGRTGAARVWHGSISRDVLHTSAVSVASVPLLPVAPTVKHFQRGVVATDFSDAGNAALALACAAVPADGIVHIVHVVPARAKSVLEPSDIFAPAEGAEPIWRDAAAELTKLAHQQAERTSCRLQVHVLESNYPDKAIAQAAERLHADFICLSKSGQPAVTRVIMGSVARGVLAETHRPVLLAQAPQR